MMICCLLPLFLIQETEKENVKDFKGDYESATAFNNRPSIFTQ